MTADVERLFDADVERLFDAVVDRSGHLEVLFHDVGAGSKPVPIDELPVGDWLRVRRTGCECWVPTSPGTGCALGRLSPG